MGLITLRSMDAWGARFGDPRKAAVVAIGNFDGVHRGHQRLLRQVVEEARSGGFISAVLTFDPHPAQVLRPVEAPSLLATLGQKLEAFDAIGIEAALVMKFDAELAQMSAEEFARIVLAETMRARVVLVGNNFRFGHKQSGDVKFLEECGRRCGFEVRIAEAVSQDGAVISSTAVRNAVLEGRMEDAERMLGRPYALVGEIQTGTGMGRKVVVPTLNLKAEQETLPKRGVYATETVVGGKAYGSATNVGMRPTFDGVRLTIESHLLNFSENLTSGKMEVRFLKRLRDEKKFAGPETLKAQILSDIEEAREYSRLRQESQQPQHNGNVLDPGEPKPVQ